MDINKSKSAILLIEFQNQWTQGGFYNKLIKRQLDTKDVIENTINLVKDAREQGVKIIHAPLIIDPECKKGWLAFVTFGKVFTKDTKKAKISDGFFREGDLLVKGRYAFDAFTGSDLESVLRKNKINDIFVCGFTTDQCVAKTLNTMIDKKFNAFLVSDCTATISKLLQKRTEKKFVDKIIHSSDIRKI